MSSLLQTTQAYLEKCKAEPNRFVDTDYMKIFEKFASEADEETKKELDIKVSDGRNLYHDAVETKSIRAVKILNKLLTLEEREKCLKRRPHRGKWERIRGGIPGLSARCKTPVHMAIGQWAEKNGNEQMYDALLEGLPPRLILTVLEADDEKCRGAYDIARSCREKNKSWDIMERVSSDIGLAKKNIDALDTKVDNLEAVVAYLDEEVVIHKRLKVRALEEKQEALLEKGKLRNTLERMKQSHEKDEKQLKIRIQKLSRENTALEARINEQQVDGSKLIVNQFSKAASRIWCQENRALSEQIRDLEHEVRKHKKKTEAECEKRRRAEDKTNNVERELAEHLARCQPRRTNSVTSDSAFSECTTLSTDTLDRLPSVETTPTRFPFQPSSTGKPGQLTLTPIQTQSSD